MKKHIFLWCFILVCVSNLAAQMPTATNDTLFGHEWIRPNQTYLRLQVANDGIYRLSAATLQNAGVPLASVNGAQFQLWRMGNEVPIFVSTTNTPLSNTDFLEFYGERNRVGLDRFLYARGETDINNTEYNTISDTTTYFLTWSNSAAQRVTTQPNDLTNLPSIEPFCRVKMRQVYDNTFVKFELGSGVYLSNHQQGEGFSNGWVSTHNVSFAPTQIVAGQTGSVTLRWSNLQNWVSPVNRITVNNISTLDTTPQNFTVRQRSVPLTAAQITPNITISLAGVQPSQQSTVAWAELDYARTFDFENRSSFEFFLNASTTEKYLEITNFNGTNPIIWDITNNLRIVATLEAGKVKCKLPPSVADRKLIIFDGNNGFQNITNVKNVSFENFNDDGTTFIIIASNRFLSSGVVNEYANYRRSAQGGNYRVRIVNIETLYDQFAYGANRHPLSVRNFANFVAKNWANTPYLLIIGKAREYRAMRKPAEVIDPRNIEFDVPSLGWPISDNLLVSKWQSPEPALPIGRLAATNVTDVRNYLTKLQLLESYQNTAAQTLEGRDWMKQIVHLNAGASAAPTINYYMNIFEEKIRASRFSPAVTTFKKTSTDPIQTAQDQLIFDRLNRGSSVITFFGHSSSSTLEYNVDDAERLLNAGRNPIFFAWGCTAGNTAIAAKGISENMAFNLQRGTSAFVATSGASFLSGLARLGDSLYKFMGNELLGKGIGDLLKRTNRDFKNTQDFPTLASVHQLNINGDPAVRWFVANDVDYTLDNSKVNFFPTVLTTQLDSFTLNFEVVNIGKSIKDSLNVLVRQQLPSGNIVTLWNGKIVTPQYRSALSLRLPLQGNAAAGANKILIKVNADNRLTEISTTNNDLLANDGSLGLPFYVYNANALPLYPQDFGIIATTPIELRASSSDAFAPNNTYFFEIDTTEYFNSPLKQRTTVAQTGGVIKWQPPMNWANNTVYYWRVSPDSVAGFGFSWVNRSFLYLNTAPTEGGWNQSHTFQFLKDSFNFLNYRENNRRWEFADDYREVGMQNAAYTNPPVAVPQSGISSGGGDLWYGQGDAGVFVAVFDGRTGKEWVYPNLSGQYGADWPPFHRNRGGFYFKTNNLAERTEVIRFLNDTVPSGSIVSFLTVQYIDNTYFPEQWATDSTTLGTSIFRLLEQQGAQQIRNLATVGARPYWFLYRKNEGAVAEKLADSLRQILNLSRQVALKWASGSARSPLIGSASVWRSLVWQATPSVTNPQNDTLSLMVFGLRNNGQRDTIFNNITTSPLDLSSVSAVIYPRLQLQFQARDPRDRTAPQLNFWRIIADPLPDLALNPRRFFAFKDSTEQGDMSSYAVAIENTGAKAINDSVFVKFSLVNQQNRDSAFWVRVKSPQNTGDTTIARFSFNSKGFEAGRYSVAMQVNPNETLKEQTLLNNFGQKNMLIIKDQRNPLLDVTFDGIHILNGDLVSATPNIQMQLKDENRFLLLSDTSLFRILVKYPNENLERQLFFNDPSVRFIPATSSTNNRARVEWLPKFTTDGNYKLSIRAKDASGNNAGTNDYQIGFEVITKSSVSNMLPYPNPFSTACRFAYTLTGSEPPRFFKIQIFTTSGKVVREITQDELGTLQIGKHLTNYVWDGTDEFGDRLANGVYLYRVVAKKADGTDFEQKTESAIDGFFNQGFGKLVIMR